MDKRSNTTRTEKVVIAVSATVVLTIAFLAVLDYSGNGAKWMGFNEVAETKETTNYDADRTAVTSIARAEDPQRSKTLWDWMQILVIPAAVAIGTFVLNQTTK